MVEINLNHIGSSSFIDMDQIWNSPTGKALNHMRVALTALFAPNPL